MPDVELRSKATYQGWLLVMPPVLATAGQQSSRTVGRCRVGLVYVANNFMTHTVAMSHNVTDRDAYSPCVVHLGCFILFLFHVRVKVADSCMVYFSQPLPKYS